MRFNDYTLDELITMVKDHHTMRYVENSMFWALEAAVKFAAYYRSRSEEQKHDNSAS